MTKSPAETDSLNLTTDFASFGEKRVEATATMPLAHGANLLLSGSVFDTTGESPLFIPELNVSSTNNGQAIGMDGEKGYHLFSIVTWPRWSLTAQFSERDKIQPISWGHTVWNDPGTNTQDTRDYVEAAYARELAGGTLKWRTYYDSYRFEGHALYPLGSTVAVEDNLTLFDGNLIYETCRATRTFRLRRWPT
jgi:hypothetical protein